MKNKDMVDEYIQTIIGIYNSEIGNMQTMKGGELRFAKGNLVESITPLILEAAWVSIGMDLTDFKYIPKESKVDIYEKGKKSGDSYKLETDGRAVLKDKYCIVKEDKAYIETSMYKRILDEFNLFRKIKRNSGLICIALEEARSDSSKKVLESWITFKPLNIILLEGKRQSNKEISRPKHYKELSKKNLTYSINKIGKFMEVNIVGKNISK